MPCPDPIVATRARAPETSEEIDAMSDKERENETRPNDEPDGKLGSRGHSQTGEDESSESAGPGKAGSAADVASQLELKEADS
jgi:hypothetical protein